MAQSGSKLPPPPGPRQRVIRNFHIAYNRTIHLYFLNAKFHPLRDCFSRLYIEEIALFWFRTQLGPFLEVWDNNSSKQRQIERKFWPQIVFIVLQMIFKWFWKARIFTENFYSTQGPTLTRIYQLKMAKMKNSHRAIQISQNPGPMSFQFSIKTIVTYGSIWAFFWVQMGPVSKIKMLRLAPLFQKPFIKG